MSGYAARLGGAVAPTSCWAFDVGNRPHHRAADHLVFWTRHADGLAVFGESLSLELAKWRRAVWDADNTDSLFYDNQEACKANEAPLEATWIDEIEKDLRLL